MHTKTSFQVSNVNPCSLPNRVMDVLINVRQEWESVAEDKSLLHCESPVGLLLFDIITRLDIPVEEQRRLLGPLLFDEVTHLVTKQG